MSTNTPLLNLQMRLLKLYASQVSEEDLLAINQRIVDYFAEKAMNEADAVWSSKGYSDEVMTQWLATDLRKQ